MRIRTSSISSIFIFIAVSRLIFHSSWCLVSPFYRKTLSTSIMLAYIWHTLPSLCRVSAGVKDTFRCSIYNWTLADYVVSHRYVLLHHSRIDVGYYSNSCGNIKYIGTMIVSSSANPFTQVFVVEIGIKQSPYLNAAVFYNDVKTVWEMCKYFCIHTSLLRLSVVVLYFPNTNGYKNVNAEGFMIHYVFAIVMLEGENYCYILMSSRAVSSRTYAGN
mgnify:CR=1 FL=1